MNGGKISKLKINKMPKSTAVVPRKTYGYGGKKKSDKDEWEEVKKASSKKSNIPKAKGIWTSISVSPFKRTPVKEAKNVKSKDEDPFSFDDDDNDCFSFKDNSVSKSPTKGKRTPSKSPRSHNPRLMGKNLPNESTTINVLDFKKDLKSGKNQIKDAFKKGTLAALKAELQSPKKSPTKSFVKDNTASPKKGSLAELKMKLQSPKESTAKHNNKTYTKKVSPEKSPVKKSPVKKSSTKKSPIKVISKKVKSPKKQSPKKESPKLQSTRKRKMEVSNEVPPLKKRVGRPKKIESDKSSQESPSKSRTDVSNKRKVGRPRNKDINPNRDATTDISSQELVGEESEVLSKKRKVGRPASNKVLKENTNDSSKPKKRGRPKKVTLENPKEDQSFNESAEETFEKENNTETELSEEIFPIDQSVEKKDDDSLECSNDGVEHMDTTESTIGHTDEESEPLKAKSVFSYYDKQKKSTENIYGESTKKNSIVFDDEDAPFSKNSQIQGKSDNPKEIPETPEKSKPPEDSSEDVEKEKKLVKSPFKSLKPNFRKYRRFSALPTDITTAENNYDEENQNEDNSEEQTRQLEKSSFLQMTNIFGQSFGSTAFRVRKDEKELFTVVRDTKHAHQCLEHGETQLFKDDLEYLLDGLNPNHNLSTRCLSALNLASKCMSPEFRMHMNAHGVIDSIFALLQDAHTDELLSLCTSAIMYILSKDRQKTGFSKKIIAFVLNIITKSPSEPTQQKTSEKINNKVKTLFEKYDDSVIDCNDITVRVLARETLLSLTSQKTGEWFKEDIQTLGGLDHICDEIYSSSRCIQKKENKTKHYKQTERCVLFLCDITFQCRSNQEYLALYREGLLISSLVRILTFITTKTDLVEDFDTSCQNCLFTTLRFLTNLSHENEIGSVKICKQEDALNCFMRCVLYMPQFIPENKTFDFIVVALGLLINLIEHSKQNTEILNTAFGPACYESEASSSIDDDISPVESLTRLFLVRNEASKEGDLMEELERLEKEQDEKDAEMHYHDGEDALVCGDKFDDTVEDNIKGESSELEKPTMEENSAPNQVELNKKEKEDIKNTLEKAHQHMEDSHVAAYSALLIGLLAEGNTENQASIHSILPDGDFFPMQQALEKILAFMKITGATNEAGFKVIQRVIDFFKECCQKYEKTNKEQVAVTKNEA